MTHPAPATPQDFFAGHHDPLAAYEKVRAVVDTIGHCDIRTSKSQVAFRRRREFAYLWRPSRHPTKPTAEVVLSIAVTRHDDSTLFKQVAHPRPPSRCITSRSTTSMKSTPRSPVGCRGVRRRRLTRVVVGSHASVPTR